MDLRTIMRNAGNKVNQYLGDVSTATAPGAGNDLLNYVINELTKYPGTTKAEAGAPKFDVANNIITNLLNLTGMNDPISQLGGPANAVIAPIGNPRLKAVFDALRAKAPGLVGKAEGLSQTLYPYLMPRELMPAEDALGLFRQSATLPKGELYLRGGRPQEEQVDTLAHEIRHFLTGFDPALADKPPIHMLETAQQLSHMMPPAQQKSMANYLSEVGRPGIAGEPLDLLKQTQGGTRKFGSGFNTPTNPELAFDEAMSYLTESLLNPHGADPALEAVANALGQGLK